MKTKKEVDREVRKKEKQIIKNIMQMSPTEIKIETKYIIYFEDHGQDFLEWHIDKNGYVLDSRPFQRRIWAGKFTIPQSAQVGEKLAIWQNGESWVNYPIKEIKIINKNDVKSAEGYSLTDTQLEINKIKKGCGKILKQYKNGLYHCNKTCLCEECQSKLDALSASDERVEK